MADALPKTPKLDELEKGKWPSFIKEIKMAAKKSPMSRDLLGQLEQSYGDKVGHWKHGGIVGVIGYGGGVIGRYSDLPDKYPEVSHFHTVRVNQPAAWFYNTDILRKLCDIWEEHGSGMTNMHGSTGDIILLGTTTDELDLRTPSCCNGMARCEWACYDTMAACYDFTQSFQDEIHRPAFPYKYKFKFAGCPNDCVASIARADMSIIGTWRDDIQVDKAAVTEYAESGMDIQADVVDNCPAKCMSWDGKELDIENSYCRRCMHCINVMPKALRPGMDRGATVLIGSKAPIVQGALLSSVLIPFTKMEPPYQDLKDIVERIWDIWSEEGKARERVGEFIQRVGLGNFLEAIEVEPMAEMVSHPRENPYVFYEEYFEEDDEDEEDSEG
jgi:sulfite reductase alpha subunit